MTDNFAQRATSWDNPSKIDMTDKFLLAMYEKIIPQKHWKAFEIGAGTGLVGFQVLPGIDCLVFEDTSEAMLDVLMQKLDGNENVEIVHGEIFDYKKQDIDFVFSSMAFHHIPDIADEDGPGQDAPRPDDKIFMADNRAAGAGTAFC